MSKQTRVCHPICDLLPTEIEGFDFLAELALNMRCSWNHATDEVWRQLDPELWETTHNPWVVLQTVSRDQIEHVLADPVFRKNVDCLVQTRRRAVQAPALRRRCGSLGRRTNPLAAMIRSTEEETMKKATAITRGLNLGSIRETQT